MIELIDVSKSYGNLSLFENVSFVFEDRKKYYIAGVNGIGKSVLLKMIVGYAKVNSGRILVDKKELGKDMDFISDAGVSINAPGFIDNYTGLENLKEIAKIKKLASEEKIMMLADILKIKEDLSKKVAKYSLGMKQKLRLIQAIMEDPKYIILDEPFDALDLDMKAIAKSLLEEEIRKGATLIFTSHDSEAKDFADVSLKIQERKIVCC